MWLRALKISPFILMSFLLFGAETSTFYCLDGADLNVAKHDILLQGACTQEGYTDESVWIYRGDPTRQKGAEGRFIRRGVVEGRYFSGGKVYGCNLLALGDACPVWHKGWVRQLQKPDRTRCTDLDVLFASVIKNILTAHFVNADLCGGADDETVILPLDLIPGGESAVKRVHSDAGLLDLSDGRCHFDASEFRDGYGHMFAWVRTEQKDYTKQRRKPLREKKYLCVLFADDGKDFLLQKPLFSMSKQDAQDPTFVLWRQMAYAPESVTGCWARCVDVIKGRLSYRLRHNGGTAAKNGMRNIQERRTAATKCAELFLQKLCHGTVRLLNEAKTTEGLLEDAKMALSHYKVFIESTV